MTLIEAITKTDITKPNTYTVQEKIRWLSVLDGIIKTEIIDTHEGAEKVTFLGYEDDIDMDTVLLVSAPYDDIYIRWLEMQMDYANAEYGKYNNSMAMYNAAYAAFEKYYNRTHMPNGCKFKFF